MRLDGKHIILGVTGSIAAYKAAYLLRLLVKEGAEVQVVMTPAAKEFITPVTMSALSNRPVASEFFAANDGTWHSHVDMGQWADLMLIAPITAATMGKMVGGVADNLLVTTYMSAKCPVMIAPAMDLDMFRHPSTLRNMEMLKSFGNIILEPGEGELASGLHGKGRMQEPEQIVEEVVAFFNAKKKLLNKHFLVTAGPTYEKIDPVRFIGNYSSGKMGFALSEALADEGAKVTLVCGPVSLQTTHKNIVRVDVESALQMKVACEQVFPNADGAIMCAAVADYRPKHPADQKIKRTRDDMSIELEATDDIAATLGKLKTDRQILVGFALETQDELANAAAKMKKKNLDFIVLNSLQDKGAGFGVDTNKITILSDGNKAEEFELKKKSEVACDIVEKLAAVLAGK
ncbi:bifunctional phosphopantothenoylcysteine decarboxylase/phosphopantothenate--cysteine ligase CoaBC [Gaoshiqia sediminis]|uniref:Coenzyme A biosynthesis bifunctional protein CoaBC n=1 Tax=Gaoshiqia sediminis TaxID=2986998 RepID=A0AA42CB77_9BACT|nr:bifunctional phosphopantothenoylcysteine decarboxylase/phosphopantothenate--cysteine ligase CoaBC [Gaoshiqia sediminis]MCW0484877.1 bifunctional phosphopantothenoylcysteine decarboxylase/phosphopantothenate--cysteine ligase CoaBC [Gaoshiqia sediminis]